MIDAENVEIFLDCINVIIEKLEKEEELVEMTEIYY
jgi:hypothetical protein